MSNTIDNGEQDSTIEKVDDWVADVPVLASDTNEQREVSEKEEEIIPITSNADMFVEIEKLMGERGFSLEIPQDDKELDKYYLNYVEVLGKVIPRRQMGILEDEKNGKQSNEKIPTELMAIWADNN